MVCNKLTFLPLVVLLAWSGIVSAQQQQQPQNFGNGNQMPMHHQQGPDQHLKNFQPGFGKNGNNLDVNNGNMKFQHVKHSGAPVMSQPQQQQPQQFGNMGMGTQGTQQPHPGNGNRVPVRGGAGPVPGGLVNGGGPGNGQFNGNGNGRLPGPVRNGNGRPAEQSGQAPSQPQQATFVPPGPMATISFGSSQAVPAQSPQSPAPSPAHFNNNGNGQGKGPQEKQAKGQANANQFSAFPQSNSIGMSVHNPNLPSTLAKNTFGVPALNSWNPQPHLAGESLKGNGSGNRFKVSSIQPNGDRDSKFNQNGLDSNVKFNSFQGPKENSGFKFPVDDAPVQDNRFGPFNDGFGNTGSASTMTAVNFGTGIGGSIPNTKGKGKNNTLKKGKFSWMSPEGQLYEISYVADLKEPAANSSPAPAPAPKPIPEDASFYKSAFPYPTTSVSIGMAEPPRNSLELFGSASAPSDYLVHANARTHYQPYGQNIFMMPPQQQRFLPGRGF